MIFSSILEKNAVIVNVVFVTFLWRGSTGAIFSASGKLFVTTQRLITLVNEQ